MDYTCHSLDNRKEENNDQLVHSTGETEHEADEKGYTEEYVNSTDRTELNLDERPEPAFTVAENVAKTSIFKTPIIIDSCLSRTKVSKHNVLKKWSEENQPLNLSKDRPSDDQTVEKGILASTCEIKHAIESSSQKNELSYAEPPWSGKPEISYCFEILKNGMIISSVDLSEKSYTVFGRLGTSDFVLEHPSVSRYHAVVQYRSVEDDNNPKGFYIYDLESTHGTFLNKERIQPRKFCRLHVGHVVKFGGSSRMFILQGPHEDEEKESEFTVTELKEMRRQHEEKLKKLEEKESEEESVEDKGIDWGMGEDAEEDLSTENPFALSTPNEDLYLDDPKKTLRGWFEREGYDLEYDVEEKGFGHFSCKIHLPIDTSTGENVYAEASVKGKKKEAVVQCALEACRILDRYGLLRQAHHESRKRKQKNWEEEDYYDSDEDTYLDRTGTIEKKREFRKRMFSKEQNVETYESLVKKLQDVEKEIETVTSKLHNSKVEAKKPEMGGNEDELDAYMSYIQSGAVDKKMQSKLQFQLNQLQQEQQRLTKLVEIARPVNLPALEKHPPNTHGEKIASTKKPHLSHSGIMKGHMLKKPKKTPVVQPQTQAMSSAGDSSVIEEEEEEEEEEQEEDIKHPPDSHAASLATDEVEMQNLEKQADDDVPEATDEESMKPGSHNKQITDIPDDKDQQSNATNGTRKAVIRGPQLPSSEELSQFEESRKTETKHRKERKDKGKGKSSSYDESNPEYAMWLPPKDQSGDGKTHLNAKYGY